ncbi:glutathione S-transferase [Dokdonella sp.]|uniref:glutathione S-transferase n=1 Tax=Dokdonella sp. TaxID=2291710 RepID=UPI0035271D07
MALPVLYSFRRCPYAIRARMALWISAQTCELREVVLSNKPVEMLAVSPKGTVPVLIDETGHVIEQSLDIMLWALRRRDPAFWLPLSTESLSDALALIAACDGEFKSALDRYKYPNRYPDSIAQESREQGARYLRSLQAILEEQRWLGGEHGGLSDHAIMPFVRQFSMVEPDWFSAQPWPDLRDWLKSLLAAPVFVESMYKVQPWTADRPGVVFPFVADSA